MSLFARIFKKKHCFTKSCPLRAVFMGCFVFQGQLFSRALVNDLQSVAGKPPPDPPVEPSTPPPQTRLVRTRHESGRSEARAVRRCAPQCEPLMNATFAIWRNRTRQNLKVPISKFSIKLCLFVDDLGKGSLSKFQNSRGKFCCQNLNPGITDKILATFL